MASSVPGLGNLEPLLSRHTPGLTDELKRYVARHRADLSAALEAGGGLEAGLQYSRALDGLLGALLDAVEATSRKQGGWVPIEVGAVGSYGRGSLSYCSDLDVRILCADNPEEVGSVAEALLYPLWDAGLSIGHQIVTVEQMLELAAEDLPTATTLLDWRGIRDSGPTSQALFTRAYEGLFGIGRVREFLDRLAERAAEREDRYGGSVYLLEPDVRNGPGGLRDFDVAHWAARARWRVATMGDLVRIGVLVPREWEQMRAASELLWKIRNLLHLRARRRMDRLSFDLQEEVAVRLGYGGGADGIELLMRDYYRAARSLVQARDMVFARAAPPPTRRPHEVSLGGGLKLINDQLTLAHPAALERDPAIALRLYWEAIHRDRLIYPFARNAVARASSLPQFGERLRASADARQLFLKLCTHVPVTRFRHQSVVRELHDVGLLLAMVPEFAPVVGRVHHDVYHVFTVDEHSLMAVDRLRALCRGELAADHVLASHLAAEIARPQVLFMAILLHDIGKDIGAAQHSKRGAELVVHVLGRLGMSEVDTRAVQHLVRLHLRLYQVATRRDIDDPLMLEDFCREVQGHEALRELYLLTVADVSTTSPTALNSWKARMLDELYVAADRWLSEGPSARPEQAEELLQLVGRQWDDPENASFLLMFLESMPERYLYANVPEDIVRHARFALAARECAVSVAQIGYHEPYVELAFTADDRPGLLAMTAATLAAHGLQVVGAQIYSWTDADSRVRSFDLFWVEAGTRARSIESVVPKLEEQFRQLVQGELDPGELLVGRRATGTWSNRPSPAVGTEVSVDNRVAARHTVIEITTRDRPRLLYNISRALQMFGLRISLAKLNTEGTLVADVFYVNDEHGEKVTDLERLEQLKGRLSSAIASA